MFAADHYTDLVGRSSTLFAFVLSLTTLQAQPRIFENGAVNAASYLPPATPGGALAKGSIFSIFGEELASEALEAQRFPLPTTLDGVQVLILTSEGETLSAPLLYVSDRQINAILPSSTPVGRHRLRILHDNQPSNDLLIKVVQSSVGIFGNHSLSYGRPRPLPPPGLRLLEQLHRRDSWTLWATGLGPTTAADDSPAPAGDLATQLEVFVGGVPAPISYQGRAPCCAGLDQINITIPEEAPLGCFVPLWAEIGGDLVSNIVALAIAPPDGACEDLHDGQLSPWLDHLVEIELNRTFIQDAILDEPRATVLDKAISMAFLPALPLRRDDIARTPPTGSCLTPTDPSYENPFGNDNSGPIAVAGPLGRATLELTRLGGPPSHTPALPTHGLANGSALQLEPGLYSIESDGSRSLPPFSGSLDTRLPAQWNNRESIPSFARETGLTLRYQADGQERRKILASIGTGNSSQGPEYVFCRSGSTSGDLRISRTFLANIPDARVELTFSDAVFATLELPQNDFGWIVHRRDDKIQVDLGPPHLASTPVTLPSGDKIQAELAVTAAERNRGLMQRPVLDRDKGMLFLFESPGLYRFWMLNTIIPLDIIWLDSDRRVLFISANTPPCQTQACPTYGPDVPSRYVLELAAGEAARRSLKPGERLAW